MTCYYVIQGVDAATNFPSDPYTSWLPPDAVATVGQIETKPGLPLTVDEIVEALKQERGVDVRVQVGYLAFPLTGRHFTHFCNHLPTQNIVGISDLAEWMVYVTGNSVPHMQKMADTIARAVSCRQISVNQSAPSMCAAYLRYANDGSPELMPALRRVIWTTGWL